MTVAFDNHLVVSLETLAQAQLEPALKKIDTALNYVERLYHAVDETGDQYAEVRNILVDLKEARGQLEAIEGTLHSAAKLAGGEITYYG
jgi:nitrate reductase assembly molybdenum cofactor insertion protein NarJ